MLPSNPLQPTLDRFIHVNGVRTRYWDVGQGGPPLVLLHAVGFSVESWAYNVLPLARGRRVLALDLVGFGHTDRADMRYRLSDLSEFVRSFLDTIGLSEVVPVGNSMGGAVALHFAQRYPRRAAGLVLAAPAGLGREINPIARLLSLPGLAALGLSRPNRSATSQFLRHSVHDRDVLTDDLIDRVFMMSQVQGSARSLLRTVRNLNRWDGQRPSTTQPLITGLRSMKMPILVVWGRNDGFIPCAHMQVVVQSVPHATGVLIEACGHIPQLERPQVFNERVMAFLDGRF
jgi:pimeloyl-ACP methyl ester carboxylesterase